MKKRLICMLLCLVMILPLMQAAVLAAGSNAPSERYYNENQAFGYDALTKNGTLEGLAYVNVGSARLNRNSASATTGAAVANGVTIGFDEGYYLDSYKIVCGDKYSCQTAASGRAVGKSDVMSGATAASITLLSDDGITKAAFGHSSRKAPYWLLLKLQQDNTLYDVSYNWGELADDITAAAPAVQQYKVNAVVTVAAPSEAALAEAAQTGENGYRFLGWQLDLDSEIHQAEDQFGMPRKNVVLTALWAEIETPTPAYYTINIPIEKTVALQGDKEPGKQSFRFEMKESYADASFEILNDTIQTDGAGTFTGFYSVRVDQDNFANLTEGFVLTEADDGAENWIYDDTQWGVVPYTDQSGEIQFRFANLSAGEEMWGNEAYDYDCARFTNTYTEHETPTPGNPDQPETPKTPETPEAPEAPETPDKSQNPSTGDGGQPWLWAALLFASGCALFGTGTHARKKRILNK